MNKRNKILVGCLALLLVLSVGYALFSETITINGTATAKGSFDIIGTCEPGIPDELISGFKYQVDVEEFTEGGYKNDTCSITGNEGSFSVDLEYPGAMRLFTFKFTNNGTITGAAGNLRAEKAKVCLGDMCNDVNFSELNDDLGSKLKLLDSEPVLVGVQIGEGEIIPYDKITQAQAVEFMDSEGNYILKPGNSAFYVLGAGLNTNVGGGNNGGSIDISNEVTYEFPFVQVTE